MLHTKYRPKAFEDVIGQRHVVPLLADAVKSGRSQVFLLSGPSGTGKTTLARICCDMLGAEAIEIDAATNTGVDSMREIASRTKVFSLSGKGKAVIVDECHRLSKQAWDSLLKDIEEPPKNVYWFFCTTDPKLVPRTVQTRCFEAALRPVSFGEIRILLGKVAGTEGLEVDPKVLDLVARHADGSPRAALVELGKVAKVKSVKEAEDALETTDGGVEAVDLAKLLLRGRFSMPQALPLLAGLKDQPPESVRITIFQYTLGACLREFSLWHTTVLSEFERPIDREHAVNRIGDIYLRVARLHWKSSKGGSS